MTRLIGIALIQLGQFVMGLSLTVCYVRTRSGSLWTGNCGMFKHDLSYMFAVVNFDALAQASDFGIKRREVHVQECRHILKHNGCKSRVAKTNINNVITVTSIVWFENVSSAEEFYRSTSCNRDPASRCYNHLHVGFEGGRWRDLSTDMRIIWQTPVSHLPGPKLKRNNLSDK